MKNLIVKENGVDNEAVMVEEINAAEECKRVTVKEKVVAVFKIIGLVTLGGIIGAITMAAVGGAIGPSKDEEPKNVGYECNEE